MPSSYVHGTIAGIGGSLGGGGGGGYYMTGEYPTSASDADDLEDIHATGPVRRTHPRGRSYEVGVVGFEERRNDNGRRDGGSGVDSVRTGSRDRDDPVRDVLSKFLDIYQDDQEKMKKKLEELAAEPSSSSSSSSSGVRFRGSSLDRQQQQQQQQTRFTDYNQAPPPPPLPSTTASATALKGGKKPSKGSSSSSSPSARRPHSSSSNTTSSSPPRPPWRSNRSPERAGDRGDNNRRGQYPGDLLATKNERESEKIRHVASSGYAHGAVGVGVNNHQLRQEEEELVGSLFHTRGPWVPHNHNRSLSPHHRRSGNNNDPGDRMNTNTAAADIPEPLFPFAPSPAPSTSSGFVSGLGRTLSSKKLSRSNSD